MSFLLYHSLLLYFDYSCMIFLSCIEVFLCYNLPILAWSFGAKLTLIPIERERESVMRKEWGHKKEKILLVKKKDQVEFTTEVLF